MALDDQLAALAAGELDDDTARALRARVAADPALARRLARHEQLERLLAGWEAPPMSEEGVRRLDARLEEALAALGDEPLAERPTPVAPTDVPAPSDDDAAGRGSGPAGVADMARARRRRDESTSGGGASRWPGWAAGAAVAAALAAVVGTGVVLGGLPGGADLDMMAGDDTAEDSPDVAQLESDDSVPTESAEEEAEADAGVMAEDSSRTGPDRREGVDVAEGELLTLVEGADHDALQESAPAEDGADTASDGDEAATAEAGPQCVEEALQRDTAQADDRRVWLVADGTYAGRDAAFVVVRTAQASQDGGGDRYEVLAYDPADCSLLARDETSG